MSEDVFFLNVISSEPRSGDREIPGTFLILVPSLKHINLNNVILRSAATKNLVLGKRKTFLFEERNFA
ncbi:MAG: hypothetical protein KAI06_09815 [Anaerolineales bacterium]|nr:hypothetical protein [Anaerolineales bacterium]